jgi:UDP-N-acetylglucosamine 1-carboxyvinyltransferase
MDKFVIRGGTPLRGVVTVSGAKNAALPAMAACLLASAKIVLKNVPNVMDVRTMKRLLERMGASVTFANNVLTVDTSDGIGHEAPYDLVKTMRASYYVLGPLLGRLGQARVSLPGGCAIGARPIDLHLFGMKELGAEIEIEHGYVVAKGRRLAGKAMRLAGKHGSSVGATINVMMAATLAKGKTIIEQAACEPEVTDVADLLNLMGAKITGAGTPVMEILGVEALHGAEHTLISDRIECGTYLVAGAITGGELEVVNCEPRLVGSVVEKLQEACVEVVIRDHRILVTNPRPRCAVDVTVTPYPGFPTDMQAQMMALATVTPGISVITETIFENRFMQVLELQRLGANIRIEGSSAIVKGVSNLTGAPVMASDLRASAALVLAGMVAEGETEISRVYHIDRGYEGIENKLNAVGARIERIHEPMG